MKIRICHPHNFKALSEFNEEKGELDGPLGLLMQESLQLIIDKVQSKLPNVTAEIQANNLEVGEFNEKLDRYDGCLGRIQTNQSDMMSQLSPYPMAIENVTQGMVLFETSLSFASGYNKTSYLGSLQLLDSFRAFSTNVWIMCVFTWLSMAVFLSVEETFYQSVRRVLGLRKTWSRSNIYQVATHLMRRGEIHPGRLTRRFTFMSASLFSLVIVHYFCSLMKTELVVVGNPLVFNSYDDVIERKAIPLFVRGMSHDSLFKHSDSKEHRRRLWHQSTKSFGRERLYMDLSAYLFLAVALTVVNQKVVVVLEEALMPLVITSGCSLAGRDKDKMTGYLKTLNSPQQLNQLISAAGVMDPEERKSFVTYVQRNEFHLPDDLLVHSSQDTRDEKFLQGFIFNANGNEIILDTLNWAIRGLIEVGMHLQQKANLEKVNLFENHAVLNAVLGPPVKKRRIDVENCRRKSILKPIAKMQSIKVNNLKSLLVVISSIYSSLLLVLALELAMFKLNKKKAKRRVRRKWC